jgi:hypothetical protein
VRFWSNLGSRVSSNTFKIIPVAYPVAYSLFPVAYSVAYSVAYPVAYFIWLEM